MPKKHSARARKPNAAKELAAEKKKEETGTVKKEHDDLMRQFEGLRLKNSGLTFEIATMRKPNRSAIWP